MKLIFQSSNFASYQCDRQRSFHIDFGHKKVKLSFCQLLALRQQINNIKLEDHFNGVNTHGMELLMLCNRQHLFIFNTHEVIALKELITNTFNLLELNSLVSTSH